MSDSLSLSLIIPVYNEEHHIRACLEAVSRQKHMPDEVIVVDNNCTDRTIDIVREFRFVTVIQEHRQGLIPARNTGFEAATSDILGRIDADAQIDSDWTQRIIERFKRDSELAGVTGPGRTSLLPYVLWPKSVFLSYTYFWAVYMSVRTRVLWGANMAIRRSVWHDIAGDVKLDDREVHEDQDISLCMAARGHIIEHDKRLLITTNDQEWHYLPKAIYYVWLHIRTKNVHTKNGNLQSSELPRMSFLRVLPGFLVAQVAFVYNMVIGLVFLPIDILKGYVKNRKLRIFKW